MHLDLRDAPAATDRCTQICVIGAGAAGITLTRRLLEAGHEVMLLESGGTDYEAKIAALAAGDNVGLDYYPLEDARLRFFGGTTAIWGGRCAELDPIDLERRSWVPNSGWPIGWDELRRYYDEARPLFGLPAGRPKIEDLGLETPAFDPGELQTPLWSFDGRADRFGFAAAKDLREHPRCTIVTHANVTSIETDPAARGVRKIVAKSLTGRTLTVWPRVAVLAAGGIENPRLLLASRSTMSMGLGNARDQVGRYFMEHPHARGGRVDSQQTWNLLKLFGRRHRLNGQDVAALIAPGEALQRREQVLNSSLTIVARQPAGDRQFLGMKIYGGLKHDMSPTKLGRALWLTTKRAASFAQRHVDPLRPWLLTQMGKLEVTLLVRAEQAPNPDSRVTLSGEVDELGMPRTQLDWRLTELDKRSVGALVTGLDRELKRLRSGSVEPAAWLRDPDRLWESDPLISAHPIGGYHHMGTTRMSDDPRTGVVARDGRVHGVDNLYVVGSSTFPTGGWANPTLTIAALSLRTADHVARALGREVPVSASRSAAA